MLLILNDLDKQIDQELTTYEDIIQQYQSFRTELPEELK
jgi:hypothetical protein